MDLLRRRKPSSVLKVTATSILLTNLAQERLDITDVWPEQVGYGAFQVESPRPTEGEHPLHLRWSLSSLSTAKELHRTDLTEPFRVSLAKLAATEYHHASLSASFNPPVR